MNPTTLHLFTRATLAAIRLAADSTQSAKVRRQASDAAYAQARALARVAFLHLEARDAGNITWGN